VELNAVELAHQVGFLGWVILLTQGLGARPDRFLQLVQAVPLVPAQDFAEKLPQQADLGSEPGLGRVG